MPTTHTTNRVTRLAGGLSAALLLGSAVAASTAAAAAAPQGGGLAVQAPQQLASLNHDTGAFVTPGPDTRRLTELSDGRPITGERTVLPVVGHATGPRGLRWLEVLLPGRPNSHTGWIQQRATTESFTRWQLTVSLSARTVTVFYAGRAVRTFSAVVGKPTTPTPTGNFFVEENVTMAATAPGAPYALALSARSNVLAQFEGGPGQTALHGIANIGGIPGTDVSHGCVRLTTADITWLHARITPGVPVTIMQ
jgi:lipoprotein-anchoring transpeptidase ErfK/SrfK